MSSGSIPFIDDEEGDVVCPLGVDNSQNNVVDSNYNRLSSNSTENSVENKTNDNSTNIQQFKQKINQLQTSKEKYNNFERSLDKVTIENLNTVKNNLDLEQECQDVEKSSISVNGCPPIAREETIDSLNELYKSKEHIAEAHKQNVTENGESQQHTNNVITCNALPKSLQSIVETCNNVDKPTDVASDGTSLKLLPLVGQTSSNKKQPTGDFNITSKNGAQLSPSAVDIESSPASVCNIPCGSENGTADIDVVSPTETSVPSTPRGKFSYVRRTSSFKEDKPHKYKKSYKNEIFNGSKAEDLPCEEIASYLLSPEVFASYSGPGSGLVYIESGNDVIDYSSSQKEVAGASSWTMKNRKAYGICLSLYDQHPVTGKMSGDPIADSFGVCARRNNGILVCADGVNWGEKSKMAARCAVYGAMKFLSQKLFTETRQLDTTRDAICYIRESFDVAHTTIMEKEGGLTTLCVALVLPMKDSRQFAVCAVNVGDSFCFVFSKRWGVREISVGSHDIQSERDIRDAGGALGPVDGVNPELRNLTCSVTFVDPGDIIFLTTDGISDNFDPVVTKIAVAMKRTSSASSLSQSNEDFSQKMDEKTHKPAMLPHERHHYSVKEMERLIHEFELVTEIPVSAQELCGAIVQHVCLLTDSKRKVLENPALYGKKLRSKDRKRRDSEIVEKMSKAPGKLDHATIVAYECGVYRGEELENYEYEPEEEVIKGRESETVQSPPVSPTVYESAV